MIARRGMLARGLGAAHMFDVYLSDRRDHLLVVENGQPIPIDQHLGRWHKKRAAVAVSDEIKAAVQRDGYYSRRLRKPQKGKRRETIRPLKIELAVVLIWCQRFQTIQCRRASRDSGNQPTNGCVGPIVGALHLAAAIRA